jgi:hypothetical protein
MLQIDSLLQKTIACILSDMIPQNYMYNKYFYFDTAIITFRAIPHHFLKSS